MNFDFDSGLNEGILDVSPLGNGWVTYHGNEINGMFGCQKWPLSVIITAYQNFQFRIWHYSECDIIELPL